MAKADLTAQRLREILNYDHESGVFTNRVKRRGGIVAGSIAGYRMSGIEYLSMSVDGRAYLAHRLAWLHVTGSWPKGRIDHINGVRTDNRISNLREASVALNAQNQRKPQRNNKSGFLGVSWCSERSKWRAQIRVNGKVVKLGRFSTPEEAHQKYLEAKRAVHAGCSI